MIVKNIMQVVGRGAIRLPLSLRNPKPDARGEEIEDGKHRTGEGSNTEAYVVVTVLDNPMNP